MLRKRGRWLVLAVLFSVFHSTLLQATPRPVSMIDLGTLPGGHESYAVAINNRGQIVGYSMRHDPGSTPRYHAVLWQDGTIIDLGTLSGGHDSYALGINDSGEIVGTSDGHPVLWQNGSITDLGFQAFDVNGINARRQIVGFDGDQAILWQNGILSHLGVLPGGGPSYGMAINARGQVVGGSFPASGEQHAVLWQDGTIIDLGTLPPGADGRSWSSATGVNDRGQVVGWSGGDGAPDGHAVLWQEERIADLGTLPGGIVSAAWAINPRGQIVGLSDTASGGYRAVLWQDGTIIDLGTLSGDYCDHSQDCSNALGINAQGQMVGWSNTSIGGIHATLWQIEMAGRPADEDQTPGHGTNNGGRLSDWTADH